MRSGRPVHFNEPGQVHHRHRGLGFEKSHHLRHEVGDVPEIEEVGFGSVGAGEFEAPGATCEVCTRDIRLYPFDTFPTDWSEPAWSVGDPAGSATLWRLQERQGWYLGGTEVTYKQDTNPLERWRISSYVGAGSVAFTSGQALCHGFDHTFAGWVEDARVFELVVGEHPSGVAGIVLSLQGFVSGVAPATGLVLVSTEQPGHAREGTLIASVPMDNQVHQIFVPVGYVPAAGETLYVQLAPGWVCQKGTFACGFNWPFNTHAKNSAKANLVAQGSPALKWAVYDDVEGSSFVGTTPEWPSHAQGGPPFDGGVTLRHGGVSGIPEAYGVQGGRMYLTAEAPSSVTFYYEEGELEVPWAGPWSYRYLFEFDEPGDPEADGERSVRTTDDGWSPVSAIVHLGDATVAPGISLTTPESAGYRAMEVEPGVRYGVRVETRPGVALMRLWPHTEGEPARWDLEVPLSEEVGDGDFSVVLSAGNGIGEDPQTIRVWPIHAGVTAQPGHWVDEQLGLGDGESDRFRTSLGYEPATPATRVDGMWIGVDELVPYEGTFRTDAVVAKGAPVDVRYQIRADIDEGGDEDPDLPDGDDTGEEEEADG